MGFDVWRRIVARLTLAAIAVHGGAGTAQASADDFAFNSCLQTSISELDVLEGQVWHTRGPDPKIQRIESGRFYKAEIARWVDRKNPNGTITTI